MISRARQLALLLLVVSAGVVGSALVSQYFFGLEPCPLCLWQRWPWYATIALALVVVLAGGRRGASWVMALCGLLLAAGSVLAAYHVGVELKIFPAPTTCTGVAGAADSVEALRAQIMGTAPVRCDEIAWSFLGISMPGWNAILSAAVAGFAFWSFAQLRGRRFA